MSENAGEETQGLSAGGAEAQVVTPKQSARADYSQHFDDLWKKKWQRVRKNVVVWAVAWLATVAAAWAWLDSTAQEFARSAAEDHFRTEEAYFKNQFTELAKSVGASSVDAFKSIGDVRSKAEQAKLLTFELNIQLESARTAMREVDALKESLSAASEVAKETSKQRKAEAEKANQTLDDARKEIKHLKDTLGTRETELTQVEARIKSLRAEASRLEAAIGEKTLSAMQQLAAQLKPGKPLELVTRHGSSILGLEKRVTDLVGRVAANQTKLSKGKFNSVTCESLVVGAEADGWGSVQITATKKDGGRVSIRSRKRATLASLGASTEGGILKLWPHARGTGTNYSSSVVLGLRESMNGFLALRNPRLDRPLVLLSEWHYWLKADRKPRLNTKAGMLLTWDVSKGTGWLYGSGGDGDVLWSRSQQR